MFHFVPTFAGKIRSEAIYRDRGNVYFFTKGHRGTPLHSLTTGGQVMPFEREMCCDIVSLNLQLCIDTLL